jgi:hypothetical protein
MVAGDFLLLAQKKVTKEKGSLARSLSRLILRLLAAAERVPGKSEARQSLPQMRKAFPLSRLRERAG